MAQTLHVISHTHWDREWYLPFQQFRMRLVRVVDDLLDIFERQQERAAAGEQGSETFRAFHLDGQAVVLEDYLEIRPGNEARLRRQIEAGRILVGPWYVLPDEFLISGESHVRNLIVGQQVVRRFGPSMRLGYLPDLFGHVSQMPQLLADAGFETAVLWRGLSGEREGLKSELYWEAPDGSRVLCIHLPEQSGYSNANNLPNDVEAALERVRAMREERGRVAATDHLLLMNGTDHHGAQRHLPALIEAMNERLEPDGPDGVRLVHATLPEYVATVRREAGANGALQVRRGELRDVNRSGTYFSNFLLHGVASARMYIKQANHRAQQALERYAEPLSAVSWLGGAPYPQGLLAQSWKYLLQNHPHDSICGCSVDEVHEQMMTRFQWSQEIADQLTVEALHQISARAARPELAEGEVAVRLYNPLSRPRDEVVETTVYLPQESAARGFLVVDGEGRVQAPVVRGDRVAVRTVEHSDVHPAPRHARSREVTLAFRAALPATGYATFRVRPLALPAWDRPAPAAQDVQAGPTWLENEHLRVDVAPNGTLTVLHKGTGRRFEELLTFSDGGDVGDEYTYSPPQRDRVVSSAGCPAAISLVEGGPTTGRLRVDLSLAVPAGAAPDRKSRSESTTTLRLSTLVTLASGSRRLECETTVDNTARDHRLRVLFPAGIETDTHHVDQAFDVVERPNDYPATPAEFWNEDAPETHPQRLFVDLSDGGAGLSLLNQGLPEYGILGRGDSPWDRRRGLALTLLRCVQYLGAGGYPSTIRSGAGPHKETPGAQCPGSHTFRYAIVPHAGRWDEAGLVQEAIAYCTPPVAFPVDDAPLPWVPPWASVNQRRAAAALLATPGAAPAAGPRPETPPFGLAESFLSVEGDGVVLSACKRAEAPDEFEGGEHGGRLVVRLYNPTEREQHARVRLRGGIARAQRASIVEEPREDLPLDGGDLPLRLPAKKILTLLLQPS